MAVASASNTVLLSPVRIGTVDIYTGTGAPAFTAPRGSLFIRTDGSSTSTRMYINTTGSTTWTNFTTAA